jgi:hypothetical protein
MLVRGFILSAERVGKLPIQTRREKEQIYELTG